MFDGHISGLTHPPMPPRPAPLDVRALMPMLRAEEAEIAVELLAVATAEDALAAVRWLELNWGADADLRDHNHPAHAAALDPSSPTWHLAEARDALSTACWRYRSSTGLDGLALARRIIVEGYGAVVADYALKPLVDSAAEWREIDNALMLDGPEPLPPEPDPTPVQRRTGAVAITEWMLSEPVLDRVREALRTLQESMVSEAGSYSQRPSEAAIKTVGDAIEGVLRSGFDPEHLQLALDCWSESTGGPKIRVAYSEKGS